MLCAVLASARGGAALLEHAHAQRVWLAIFLLRVVAQAAFGHGACSTFDSDAAQSRILPLR
jgi:hypothetical protein